MLKLNCLLVLWSVTHVSCLSNNEHHLLTTDCSTCATEWLEWSTWSSCKGKQLLCEKDHGKKWRTRDCVLMIEGKTSRADYAPPKCTFNETVSCIDETTCVGHWTGWMKYSKCTKEGDLCLKTRKRSCVNPDSDEIIPNHLCIGGIGESIEKKPCTHATKCLVKMSKANGKVEKHIANDNPGFNTNAAIILSVAICSLVVGGCLMFAILRWVVRRKHENDCGKGDWVKGVRNGSLNQHSTATCTTVMSPSQTPNCFNNETSFVMPAPVPTISINRSISVPGDTFVPEQDGHLLNVPPVERNDNVYWEIIDCRRNNTIANPHITEDTNASAELVNNILYASTQ